MPKFNDMGQPSDEFYLIPAVYDVPPSEWTSTPVSVGQLLAGALDDLEDVLDNPDRRVQYYEYLKSEKWAVVRRIIRRRAQNKCELCGQTRQVLNVHHVTYARLGFEDLTDLMCLCRDCHRKEHNIKPLDHPYSEAN